MYCCKYCGEEFVFFVSFKNNQTNVHALNREYSQIQATACSFLQKSSFAYYYCITCSLVDDDDITNEDNSCIKCGFDSVYIVWMQNKNIKVWNLEKKRVKYNESLMPKIFNPSSHNGILYCYTCDKTSDELVFHMSVNNKRICSKKPKLTQMSMFMDKKNELSSDDDIDAETEISN
jgi:hypothetical protein